MNRILITGASGFLGRYIVRFVLEENHFASACDINPAVKEDYSGSENFEFFNFDISKPLKSPAELFGRPDTLIHLAWENTNDYKNPSHLEKTLPDHKRFLETVIKSGLKNINVIGTCYEYGMKQGKLSEDITAYPIVPYAAAKNELRKYLESLKAEHGFSLKWIRLFYTYGPGQRKQSFFEQLKTVLQRNEEVFNMSDGNQCFDFIPVETAAGYIVRISLQNKVTGIINCGTGRGRRLIDLVNSIIKESGKTIKLNRGYYPPRDFEPNSFWADTEKMKLALEAYEKMR